MKLASAYTPCRGLESTFKLLNSVPTLSCGRVELPKTKKNSAENNTASSSTAHPSLVAMASQRQAETETQAKEETERRLSALQAAMGRGEADDERAPGYHLLCLRRWTDMSSEETVSTEQEVTILRDSSEEASTSRSSHQARSAVTPPSHSARAPSPVFGAGYPRLASATGNDWCDQHGSQELYQIREQQRQH